MVTIGHMRKRLSVMTWSVSLVAGGLLIALTGSGAQAKTDPAVEKRVDALLSQMTLDEKVGQMTQADMNGLKNKADVKTYFLGSVLSGGNSDPADETAKGWAQAVAEFKSWGLQTRLKIPVLYGIDAVHGHNNVDGAVMFPHNIGMGATRSPMLVQQEARVTAEELAATGIRWAFAPCLAVAQDARWGRTYESFGENPELAELLGGAAVRGFQGTSWGKPGSVLACAKHFLGDGGTTQGTDQGNTECDEATLRKIHLPGYRAAIKAGVGSVMVSYSSWNGKKMHGNKYLLTDLLKGELGFDGFLISDWAAIDQLGGDYKKDVEMAVNAGLDMGMIPNGPGEKNSYVDFIRCLKELVAEQRIPQARIDDAVRRILRAKIKLGLLDEDASARPPELASVGSPEHRAVARDCVRHSLVLLKNANHALPLSKSVKRLVVVGKAADDIGIQCGGWTIDWQGRAGPVTKGGTTILAAVRKTVSAETAVAYSADGADLNGADAIVVVVGEMPYAEMKGDRPDLQLTPEDQQLIAKVKQGGVPVVTILFSGRPLVLGGALEQSDAFLAAWLPGTEGQGVADVLFGDFRPTGKLPRTWPANAEQVANPPSAKQSPLFAYGFGLTYGPGRSSK